MSVEVGPRSEEGHAHTVAKIVLATVAIAALVAMAKHFDLLRVLRDALAWIQQVFLDALAWISGLGPLGPAIFIALYIVACVLLLPGSVLTLGAGVLFGVVTGSVTVSIGSILGATCAFLVGRYLARGWVARRIAGHGKFKAVDEAVAREGWKIVLLTRLSPIFPFSLLNYAFGLTQIRLKHYFLASWVGMAPGTVMYVYIGSLAGDLATLGAGGRARTTGEWVLYGAGLLATVAVTVFVTRLARKALAGRISS